MWDVLFLCLFAICALQGYNSGALRDTLQFIIWVPLVSMIFMVSWNEADQDAMRFAQSGMKTIGNLFGFTFLSYFISWVIDKAVFGHLWDAGRLSKMNKRLGILTGAGRVALMVFAALTAYKAITKEEVPDMVLRESFLLRQFDKQADKAYIWLQDHGYADPVKIYYDARKQAEDAENQRLMELLNKASGAAGRR